jgi:tryptophan synthase alpha chain
MTHRIAGKFAALKRDKRKGLVTFVMAGDPDPETGRAILSMLPRAGADFVELGMPFSDPMADGPAIQESGLRALAHGMTLEKTLEQAASFRAGDGQTPLILMGYYNPIYSFGTERFALKARESGVDGLIVVDLPPEEDAELYGPARKAGIDLIRLVTPTTTKARLETILRHASGFLYYVSITGVTGTASADEGKVARHLAEIRSMTDMPLAIGFGINTPDDAARMVKHADAVVVGSALVRTVGEIGAGAKTRDDLAAQVSALARALR